MLLVVQQFPEAGAVEASNKPLSFLMEYLRCVPCSLSYASLVIAAHGLRA